MGAASRRVRRVRGQNLHSAQLHRLRRAAQPTQAPQVSEHAAHRSCSTCCSGSSSPRSSVNEHAAHRAALLGVRPLGAAQPARGRVQEVALGGAEKDSHAERPLRDQARWMGRTPRPRTARGQGDLQSAAAHLGRKKRAEASEHHALREIRDHQATMWTRLASCSVTWSLMKQVGRIGRTREKGSLMSIGTRSRSKHNSSKNKKTV